MADPGQNINQRAISPKELAFEFMLMHSRLKLAIPKQHFTSQTGLTIGAIRPQLDRALTLELIEESEKEFKLTTHGFRYLNEFQSLFL